jgi:hypothetical protein
MDACDWVSRSVLISITEPVSDKLTHFLVLSLDRMFNGETFYEDIPVSLGVSGVDSSKSSFRIAIDIS